MIKMVALMKRKAGISTDEFINYYENHHTRLFQDKLKGLGIVRYVRRYFTPIADPISGELRASAFDGIMEVWFENEQSFHNWHRGPKDPNFTQIVLEDEAKLFDKSQAFFNTVKECETPIPRD